MVKGDEGGPVGVDVRLRDEGVVRNGAEPFVHGSRGKGGVPAGATVEGVVDDGRNVWRGDFEVGDKLRRWEAL